MIDLFIVAEIRLFREGLAQALGSEPGIRVVGTAAHHASLADELRKRHVDLVLVDMSIPESAAASRAVARVAPEARIVGLGVADSERDVIACAEAGLAGYVPRDASLEELVTTLKSVSHGEMPCSPRMAAVLMRRVAALAAQQPPDPVEASLTARELEILDLIEEGLSNKEIAARLAVELATVKKHVHNLLEKLHVHRRTEAAAWARRRRLDLLEPVGPPSY